MKYSFFVNGIAKPKGSKTLVRVKSGRYTMRESAGVPLKDWMKAVSLQASQTFSEPMGGPIQLYLTFYMRKPKRMKRELPCVRPDLDKLIRGVNDALSNIAFFDDSQVVVVLGRKVYAKDTNAQGCFIQVGTYEEYQISNEP